jgi:uncharacterized protein (DUF2126 family)
MEHPFKDKLVTFIGTPLRCKRQEARDALIAVGGVPDDGITTFTDYAVAFHRASERKIYEQAAKNAKYGLLILLNEEQFFDILDGKAQPPEPPPRDKNITVYPARNQEELDREQEQFLSERLAHKKMQSMKRDGVETPEGRVKIDMGPLETLAKMARAKKEMEK